MRFKLSDFAINWLINIAIIGVLILMHMLITNFLYQ